MSRLPSFNFAFLFLLLLCFVQNSRQQRDVTSRQCRHSYHCRRRGEICCKNVCATSCEGKYCRFSFHCGQDKCCASRCRKTCEGSRCYRDRQCGGKSLKCCARICRESCLGSRCSTSYRPQHTCGYHRSTALMQCCGGNCSLSCQDTPCRRDIDCGGWGTRLKCCGGTCKKSCIGISCEERRECKGLRCCGFPGSKVCARTCHMSDCASNDDCLRERGWPMRCCGDSTCRPNCLGSVCYAETFVSDCAGPSNLYCCGIGKMECRYDCRRVPCKTNADCGPSFFYCGQPNSQNISTCTENSHGMYIYQPLEG